MTAANTSGGTSAGFELGFTYRAGILGIGAHGRAGGIGSATDKLSTASIDLGGRLYLSSGEFAPFLSTGLGLSHFNLKRAGEPSIEGSGFGAFAALGIEMLRTHHVGVLASLRADLPFYQLQGTDYSLAGRSQKTADYVVPISLNLGMMFH